MDNLTMQNPVVKGLIFYSSIVVLKMFMMAFLTVRQRLAKQIFLNKEDITTKNAKVASGDEDIERVRRNHLNDLENIPSFIFAAILYTMTGPSPQLALWHFRVFTLSRITHTIVYQLGLPHRCRAICFLAGLATTASMLIQSIVAVSL